MATQFPFSCLSGVLARLAPLPQPPQWLVDEMQHRTVLFLNHVLQQEPAATERLLRQRRRVVHIQWLHFSMALQVTPAGLFDLAPESTTPDLRLEVTQNSPVDLAQMVLRGERPPVRIDGDVQFAGDIQWLADNLRWDIEEDLARCMGDVPAHALTDTARRVMQAVRQFVGSRMTATEGVAPVEPDERSMP